MFVIAISALPLLVMLVYRYPMLLLCAFPVVDLVDVFVGYYPFYVGGLNLLPMDSVYFLTISYFGVSVLRHPRKLSTVFRENMFLTLFLALLVLHVVIYTPMYGQSAVGEARKFYGFFVFPILALVILKTPEQLRRLVKILILTTAVVAVLVIGIAAMSGSIIRAANATAALMIAFATFAMLIHRFHKVIVFTPAIDQGLLLLFAGIALVSGQRTVWLTLGAGCILLLWVNFGRPNVVMKCAALALALFLAGGSALVYFPDFGLRLGELFEGILNPHSDATASWRIEGWQYQVGELRESGQLLFGEGLGSYYHWRSRTAEVTDPPHNGYVTLLLKFGLLGLVIYAGISTQFFVRVLAARKKIRSGPMRAYIEIGLLNVGAGHAYLLGYDFTFILMAYFAIAISAVRLCEQQIAAEYQPFKYLRARHISKRWALPKNIASSGPSSQQAECLSLLEPRFKNG